MSFQAKYIRCGKATCRSCPHGPYWYRYWREGKKTRCEYVGKVDPRKDADKGEEETCRLDEIFDRRKATAKLAFEILGLPAQVNEQAAKKAYRDLSKKLHPDRGGDHRSFVRLNAAWSYLKALNGWK